MDLSRCEHPILLGCLIADQGGIERCQQSWPETGGTGHAYVAIEVHRLVATRITIHRTGSPWPCSAHAGQSARRGTGRADGVIEPSRALYCHHPALRFPPE